MRQTTRRALLVAIGLVCLIEGVWFVWALGALDSGLPSDDALYFAHGIVRFSVLEFSPHFPGYPGFVLLGRLAAVLESDPERALGLASTITAYSIPFAMAFAVARLGGAVFWAVVLGFAQPLFLGLAISFLSDSSGLLFLLLGLTFATPMPGRAPKWMALFWSGAALGFSLACRPSYGPLILAAGVAVLAIWFRQPNGRRLMAAFVGGGLLVVLPLFGAVLAWEGPAYLDEGWRFLEGHTTLWGQTLWSSTPVAASWLATIGQLDFGMLWVPLLTLAALVVVRYKIRDRALVPWLATGLVALVWALTMQNPANARHLAPVLSIVMVLAACLFMLPVQGLGRRVALTALLLLVYVGMAADTLHWAQTFPAGAPPLQQVAKLVEPRRAPDRSPLLITNHGVALLRQQFVHTRVVDPTYGGDVESLLRTWRGGAVYWLRSTPLGDEALVGWREKATVRGRAWGEAPLWLYQKMPPGRRSN